MNIFENASRNKLRFETSKGNLTVEQLWDLPMTSEKGLSLNEIGTGIQRAIREMGEDSLISTGANPDKAKATLRLDLIKHIIAIKQEENAKARKASSDKAEADRLKGILARKQEAADENLSPEELQARIAALEST